MTLPMYIKKETASAPFKLLVAHHQKSSDPSKGESGNPVAIRQGFETQLITTQRGTGAFGLLERQNLPSLVIKVNTTDYFNQRTANPPPYYNFDEIQAYAHDIEMKDMLPSLKAGDHFGQAIGNGVGAVADLASELSSALNDLDLGISASVSQADNTRIEVAPSHPNDNVILTVISYSYLILNGAPPFTIEDTDGNTIYDPAVVDSAVGTVLGKSRSVKPISSI